MEELKNLNETDSKIIAARKTGFALCDLSKEEYEASLTGIIFNISVICGCQLPTHDAHVNALEKEFTIFLSEFGYSNLTSEEILTAFRMNANFKLEDKIETYGALFNIDFAAKVLSQYRDKRWNLDRNLGDVYVKRENDKFFAEEDKKRRLKIKDQFAKYLADENSELELTNCFMQLCHDDAFFNVGIDKMFLQKATAETKKKNDATKLDELLSAHGINLEASFIAGKMAVRYLFDQMKKSGKYEIYDENLKLIHKGFQVPEEPKEPMPF